MVLGQASADFWLGLSCIGQLLPGLWQAYLCRDLEQAAKIAHGSPGLQCKAVSSTSSSSVSDLASLPTQALRHGSGATIWQFGWARANHASLDMFTSMSKVSSSLHSHPHFSKTMAGCQIEHLTEAPVDHQAWTGSHAGFQQGRSQARA